MQKQPRNQTQTEQNAVFLYFIAIRGEVTAAAGLVAWSVVGMHTQEP